MSETNTECCEPCFGYKPYNGGTCSVLRDGISEAYRELGWCNTVDCPFYKPKTMTKTMARIGDSFVPYSDRQRKIVELTYKPIRANIFHE